MTQTRETISKTDEARKTLADFIAAAKARPRPMTEYADLASLLRGEVNLPAALAHLVVDNAIRRRRQPTDQLLFGSIQGWVVNVSLQAPDQRLQAVKFTAMRRGLNRRRFDADYTTVALGLGSKAAQRDECRQRQSGPAQVIAPWYFSPDYLTTAAPHLQEILEEQCQEQDGLMPTIQPEAWQPVRETPHALRTYLSAVIAMSETVSDIVAAKSATTAA